MSIMDEDDKRFCELADEAAKELAKEIPPGLVTEPTMGCGAAPSPYAQLTRDDFKRLYDLIDKAPLKTDNLRPVEKDGVVYLVGERDVVYMTMCKEDWDSFVSWRGEYQEAVFPPDSTEVKEDGDVTSLLSGNHPVETRPLRDVRIVPSTQPIEWSRITGIKVEKK